MKSPASPAAFAAFAALAVTLGSTAFFATPAQAETATNPSASALTAQRDEYIQKLQTREKLVREDIEFKKRTRDRLEEEIRQLENYADRLRGGAERAASVSEASDWEKQRVENDKLLADEKEPGPFMASPLEKEWSAVKEEYKHKFEKATSELEGQMDTLRKERDFGDAERRDEITERLSDLTRAHDRMKQRRDELRAATAIDWMNLKNRIADAFEDMKD